LFTASDESSQRTKTGTTEGDREQEFAVNSKQRAVELG